MNQLKRPIPFSYISGPTIEFLKVRFLPSKRPEIRDFIFADKELSVHELRSKYCKVKLRHKVATYLGYDRTLKVIKLVQNAKNFFVKR